MMVTHSPPIHEGIMYIGGESGWRLQLCRHFILQIMKVGCPHMVICSRGSVCLGFGRTRFGLNIVFLMFVDVLSNFSYELRFL
jgi:hypothetical protein